MLTLCYMIFTKGDSKNFANWFIVATENLVS